jgi:5-methylcytosine-specific restriction endonuclease McrA
MRKIQRADCPQDLIEKGPEWTQRFVARRKWTGWPQHGNRQLNHILQDEGLRNQTQDHCSYCDTPPISPPGEDTIDHFRPKSGPQGHPHLAYTWENLFYCCTYCQGKKRDQIEEVLLTPGEANYEFLRYFQ